MDKIVEISVGGRMVKAMEMDFTIKEESWNEYSLLDGGTVRLKTSVLKILWILGSSGEKTYNADGEPALAVRHKSDVVASN